VHATPCTPRRPVSVPRDMELECVLKTVADATGVSRRQLMQPTRGMAHIASARQLAVYLVHVLLERSLTDVGRCFGRDRTTIAHACSRIEDQRDDGDPDYELMVSRLEDKIRA